MESIRTTSTVSLILPQLLLLTVCRGETAMTATDGYECPMGEYEPAPEGAHLVDDVLWAGRPERSYTRSQYRRRPAGGGFELCTCATKRCVLKCCKSDKMYVGKNCTWKSNETADKFTVPSYDTSDGKNNFHLIYRKPKCLGNTSTKVLTSLKNTANHFEINESGWLKSDSGSNNYNYYAPGQFCLEQFSNYESQILPMVCKADKTITETNGLNIYYKVLALVISLPFLFMTFLIYALIEKLRNLHGKSLMCYVGMLLVAYTGLIVDRFPIARRYACVTLAFTIQFSFLASFFWLNVMCFDLWWTFSGFRPFKGNLKQYELKKFKMYSAYAWGCTALISTITYCMYWASAYASPTLLYLYPEFGKINCGFSSKTANLIYFYGPIGILLISNLLMFLHTTAIIVKQIRDIQIVNRSGYEHEKQRFVLYLKLFIVMGVIWILELLSFWFNENDENYVWYVIDIGNGLQGVFIFLIFVCKRHILELLIERLGMRSKSTETYTTPSTKTQYSSNLFKSSIIETVQLNAEYDLHLCDDVRPNSD